jgi:hypothetical protein
MFEAKKFSTLGGQLKGGIAYQVFGYLGDLDDIDTISTDGYFNMVKESLRVHDVIRVLDITGTSSITELMVTTVPLSGNVKVISLVDNSAGECAVSMKNVLIIDEVNDEIVGKRYKTYTSAFAYAKAQTPSETNLWSIQLAGGIFSQDMDLDEWIHPIGIKDSTVVTGKITCNHGTSKIAKSYSIYNCAIINLSLTEGTPIVNFVNCDMMGGLAENLATVNLFNGRVFDGDFTACYFNAYYSRIAGGSFSPYTMSSFYFSNFVGGILTGGTFIGCAVDGATLVFDDSIYAFNMCTLLDEIDMDENSGSFIYMFNSYHSGIIINTGNGLGAWAIQSLSGTVTEAGGTFTRGDGDFTQVNTATVKSYLSTLDLQNTDGYGFQINADGLLTSNISNYEALVLADNDIPNRKFVMDLLGGMTTDYVPATSTPTVIGASGVTFGVNVATNPTSIVLPDATDYPDRVVHIKDESGLAGTNNIVISVPVTTPLQYIDGVSSYTIDDNYGAMSAYSNGVNWFVF